MLTDQILCFLFGAVLTALLSYAVYSERLFRVRASYNEQLQREAQRTARAQWENSPN